MPSKPEPPRLLARSAPRVNPRKPREAQSWTRDQEAGYTDIPARSLLDAGEAVSREEQARITAEAHTRDAERDRERRDHQQRYQVCRRLMKARGALERGATITPHVARAVKDLETAIAVQNPP